MRRWARFAEDVGFHLIMISDHVAVTPDVQALFPRALLRSLSSRSPGLPESPVKLN